MPNFAFRPLLVLALPLGLIACSDATSRPAAAAAGGPAAPQAVTVEVHPPTANVPPGTGYQFASVVTGTSVTAVTWTVKEGATGGSVDPATGYYTAPSAPGTYHVEATSQASPASFGEATVTVPVPTPVTVTISPRNAAIDACKTQKFTATVTGATNTAVTWSVQEATGGAISAGTYTAPSTAGIYHVVASAVAQPTAVDSVPISVSDHVLAVAVTPPSVTVSPSGTAQFTATVTTSCGQFTSTQVVAVAR